MKNILTTLLLISLLSGCASKPAPKTLLDRIKAIQTHSEMPGLQVSVIENGKEIFSYVDGVRAIGSDDKVTAMDKWHLGSCTKPMTAFLIGMLVDQKKLSWDTPLIEIFPKNTLHPTLQTITVAQLLTHSSGLADITAPETGALWAKLFTDKANMRERLVKGLFAMPAKFTPGSKEEYSNSGYVVLGSIIERLTKKSWEEVMKLEVFNKLGMQSCGFGAAQINAPWGHSLVNGKMTAIAPGLQADNPPAIGPSGTVHCSSLDWSKFLALYLNNPQQTLVSASTLEKLKTNADRESYFTFSTIARMEREWAKGPVFAMAGSNTLNYAYVAIAPALGRIYTVNTNSGTDKVSAGATEILRELTKL